jgi:hypothetical protein
VRVSQKTIYPFFAHLAQESGSVEAIGDDAMRVEADKCHKGEENYPDAVCKGSWQLKQIQSQFDGLPTDLGFTKLICGAAELTFSSSGHPVKAAGGQKVGLTFPRAGSTECWKAIRAAGKDSLAKWSTEHTGKSVTNPGYFKAQLLVLHVQVRA